MSRVFVYDTTLRDGSQGEGVNFSLNDKLLITKKLDDLGIDFIEGGYPLSNPKDFEYFQAVAGWCRRRIRGSCGPRQIFYQSPRAGDARCRSQRASSRSG